MERDEEGREWGMEGDMRGESEAEEEKERWPIDIVGELVVARGGAGPGRFRARPADDDAEADDEEDGRCGRRGADDDEEEGESPLR